MRPAGRLLSTPALTYLLKGDFLLHYCFQISYFSSESCLLVPRVATLYINIQEVETKGKGTVCPALNKKLLLNVFNLDKLTASTQAFISF